jgi:predicted RNA-binding protein YlxR (DUF448 family)
VTGPDGSVVPDVFGKLPGRGYYVRADGDVLEQAVAKKVFSRGAKAPVTVPDNLLAEVDRQMVHRVVTLVSLARKSGHAIAGFEKSKTWLENGRAKVLIQASDGSERGKTKLNTPRDGRFIGWLTADELGLAFGRQTVIHGALASGGLSRLVIEEANRLRGVRKMNGGKSRSEGKKA